MKTALRLIFLVAVLAGGIWLWRELFPPPEKVIAARLEKMARAASVQPGEGTLLRIADAHKVGDYCASNVDISIDLPHHQHHALASRDDIVQGLTLAKTQGGLTVKFHDILVTIGPDGTTADAEVTIEAHVTGESDVIIQQMKFTLQKIDGQWLVTKVQTVRPLS